MQPRDKKSLAWKLFIAHIHTLHIRKLGVINIEWVEWSLIEV